MVGRLKLSPRIRVVRGADVALGPGKVDLLDQIERTGRLGMAAAAMEMSYMRAWTLVQTMNRCFKKPLVALVRGGKEGGRAELTATGQRALSLYREMESKGLAAMQPAWKQLVVILDRR